jgi:hypothetical protein
VSIVYIPQVPSRFDNVAGVWYPTVSIKSAAAFGELRVMLPPEASRLDPEKVLMELKGHMREFSEDDYLLALGSPTIYSMAAVIAANKTDGFLRLLEWDRRESAYKLVEVQVWRP